VLQYNPGMSISEDIDLEGLEDDVFNTESIKVQNQDKKEDPPAKQTDEPLSIIDMLGNTSAPKPQVPNFALDFDAL